MPYVVVYDKRLKSEIILNKKTKKKTPYQLLKCFALLKVRSKMIDNLIRQVE